MEEAKHSSNNFFSWLYPSRCGLCSMLGEEVICDVCRQEFIPTDSVSRPFDDGPLELVASLYPYSGRPGQAVRRLKYSRATVLVRPLAAMLRDGAERLGLLDCDLVVPIPIHWSRRCIRGFNQSELLCEALPSIQPNVLQRIRRTKPQARLTREERMFNLSGAFRAVGDLTGRKVLLVDDVVTSGHTARECARALAEAGASSISVLAFAGEGH